MRHISFSEIRAGDVIELPAEEGDYAGDLAEVESVLTNRGGKHRIAVTQRHRTPTGSADFHRIILLPANGSLRRL
ncbi:hypothetical protein ACSMXN_05465 [Jatrophihabitans sp. DSM 45814]